jgi:hypothetical protein
VGFESTIIWVIVAILAIAAVEVTVLVVWARRRRRRHPQPTEQYDATADQHTAVVSPGRQRRVLAILGIVFGSIGLVMASVAGVWAAVVAESISGDQYADGTVVALDYDGKSYSPVVEFATPGGTRVRITSWVGSNPSSFDVGEHVGVRYKPDNPNDAVINQYWQIWFLPTLLAIIAAPFLAIGTAFGIVTLVRRLRSRSQPAPENQYPTQLPARNSAR